MTAAAVGEDVRGKLTSLRADGPGADGTSFRRSSRLASSAAF